MKNEQDYIEDIAEIRSMMERSSKFLSLSGWAGIMAGIYALAATWAAHSLFGFWPDEIFYTSPGLTKITFLAATILALSLITAVYFSWEKALTNNKSIWNATSRRLLASMAVPLVSGGILSIIFISKDLIGFVAPATLLFYGLALVNAGHYTIREVRLMGYVQIGLGLLNAGFIEYGLLFWALGFGIVHIIYGVYMHFRYER